MFGLLEDNCHELNHVFPDCIQPIVDATLVSAKILIFYTWDRLQPFFAKISCAEKL